MDLEYLKSLLETISLSGLTSNLKASVLEELDELLRYLSHSLSYAPALKVQLEECYLNFLNPKDLDELCVFTFELIEYMENNL
jgi:hypothetical protein